MKISKRRIHTYKKHRKPTLHSLIANHVLEMSGKLKFQCVRFENKHCFALVVLNWFPIFFVTLKSRTIILFVLRLKVMSRNFAQILDILHGKPYRSYCAKERTFFLLSDYSLQHIYVLIQRRSENKTLDLQTLSVSFILL